MRSIQKGEQSTNNIIRIEELFFAILAVYFFTFLDYAWWWFALLFFAPGLSFFAYAAAPRVGGNRS